MKKAVAILLFTFAIKVLPAQVKLTDETYRQYQQFVPGSHQSLLRKGHETITSHTPARSGNYYIGKLKPLAASAIATAGIRIIRTLHDGHAILFFQKEIAATADWCFILLPVNDNWKLSPLAEQLLADTKQQQQLLRFSLQLAEGTTPETLLAPYQLQPAATWPALRIIEIITTPAIIAHLQRNSGVIFIDQRRTPIPEAVQNGLDLSANHITATHRQYPALNGDNLTASIKENKFDSSDIDFLGRFVPTTVSATQLASHADNMATTLGGGGNNFFNSKGVAWGVKLSSSSFIPTLPDNNTIYTQYNISVQNHSYGVGIENIYGNEAQAYDASVVANPKLVHVFSAGNSGNFTTTTGPYANIPAFANLTGNFKMAKNVIVTGAADSVYRVELLSSRGPAYDGRVKPDLVAFGESGSSGAAAIVSGSAIVLQQAYRQVLGGTALPDAALTKALLINSADELNTPGPDYVSGYGSLNLRRAADNMLQSRYFSGSIANGASQSFNITVPANARRLKVTLVWTDPVATVNAAKALVNDLDLTLSLPAASQSWQPWVLRSFAHVDSLRLPAERRRDNLNNVEQVTLDNPAAGTYTILVAGTAIPSGAQTFYVAYQWDTLNTFRWSFPSQQDNLLSGERSLVRWESTYGAATGLLEFSRDGGSNWQTVQAAASLANGYAGINVPDTFSTGRLRMTVGSDVYLSEVFTISKPLDISVGFNCSDSFLLYWPKLRPLNSYTLYTPGTRYLTPVTNLSDSFVVGIKATRPELLFAVAPLVAPGRQGIRSYLYNYTTQGTGCYIKNFLAGLTAANTVLLQLELGTRYNVQRVSFEKQDRAGQFVSIFSASPVAALQNDYADASLRKGGNVYRAKVELTGGRIVYSEPQVVYYFANEPYLVFPNPVRAGERLSVLANNIDDTYIVLYNSSGAKVYEKQLTGFSISLSLAALPRGMYRMVILRKNEPQWKGTIVLQ